MTKLDPTVFDFAANQQKVDKEIARQFSASFMSNSKWKKFFALLDAVDTNLQVIWKFVAAQNDGVRHTLPPLEALAQTYLTDRFWLGPCYYKEIEWIEILFIAKPYGKGDLPITHRRQNVDGAKEALSRAGEWEMETNPNGLRIYGHK